jgi:hypothetical protein
MSKYDILKNKFIEDYCKYKYAICIIIFIVGVMMLVYFIFLVEKQTKLIENYSSTEDSQNANIDLTGVLKINLADIIKRLFAPKCLAGCMSPDNTNRNDAMCKKKVNEDGGVVLQCPWRCNTSQLSNQMKENIRFKHDVLTKNLRLCSVENENIDCGGCVPLRSFD